MQSGTRFDIAWMINHDFSYAILDYLKAHPTATRQEVAESIGNITEDGVKYNIGKLQQYGRLKRENGRKNGSWLVIDLKRETK